MTFPFVPESYYYYYYYFTLGRYIPEGFEKKIKKTNK